MNNNPFVISKMAIAVALTLLANNGYAVEFNTDVLDSGDKNNIDFSRFSQAGYIMPGQYQMRIVVNGKNISTSNSLVDFIDSADKKEGEMPQACLTPDMVDKFGLTEAAQEKLGHWNNDRCIDLSKISGAVIEPDMSEAALNISMPQAWLEYSDASWLPTSRWEEGIPGLLLDYNVNGMVTRPDEGKQTESLSINGTTGLNAGAWRLRGDYQGSYSRSGGAGAGTNSQYDWTRFYMYRALPRLRAKLTLGENYINSDIFNSWSYTGMSVESDDRMLPPKLRGYAPQITGIADTNARVIVTQQDRILYDTTVPPGPFTIQDLDSSVRGRLDVEVIESNGEKKRFYVDTASIPYLTRPGQIRYKFVGGRSRFSGHSLEGPVFGGGEISWGISNNWSLYGGTITSGDYNALAVGVGRDMQDWGTLSSDMTQSIANINGDETKKGKSWRLSYSKRFDDANTDITFSGYRFSERNYMTMQQYLDTRYHQDSSGQDKELYTVALNKYFTDLNLSVNLQYSHQTYWDDKPSDYYTLSVNRYFDLLGFKNMSLGLTGSRSKYRGNDNDAFYLRLTLPLGNGTASYNGSMNDSRYTQTVGYSSTLNEGQDSYSINAGINHGDTSEKGGQLSGFYSKHSSLMDMSASFATVQNSYSSLSLSAMGGATVTTKGAALHAGGINGSTRMLVSTDGVGGVPVDGGRVVTNKWGTGVITDVSSYYRNTVSVDLDKLDDDVEATHSVVETFLTEGAIGYRKFGVLKGARLFVVLKMADNTHPPFGASVMDSKGRELGMVGDEGLAWLSGVSPGESLKVRWNGAPQCQVGIPQKLDPEQLLLLPCSPILK